MQQKLSTLPDFFHFAAGSHHTFTHSASLFADSEESWYRIMGHFFSDNSRAVSPWVVLDNWAGSQLRPWKERLHLGWLHRPQAPSHLKSSFQVLTSCSYYSLTGGAGTPEATVRIPQSSSPCQLLVRTSSPLTGPPQHPACWAAHHRTQLAVATAPSLNHKPRPHRNISFSLPGSSPRGWERKRVDSLQCNRRRTPANKWQQTELGVLPPRTQPTRVRVPAPATLIHKNPQQRTDSGYFSFLHAQPLQPLHLCTFRGRSSSSTPQTRSSLVKHRWQQNQQWLWQLAGREKQGGQ